LEENDQQRNTSDRESWPEIIELEETCRHYALHIKDIFPQIFSNILVFCRQDSERTIFFVFNYQFQLKNFN